MNFSLLQTADASQKSTSEEIVNALKDYNKWGDLSGEYLPKIIAALAVALIGYWLIKWVMRLSYKIFSRNKVDRSLQTFLTSVIRIALNLLLALTIISILGINITGFAALLAGAGLAIGGALNGTLGNFAGGVMILILKPFRVGDLIKAHEVFGIVSEIGIVYTSILTAENKTIQMPNGMLSTGVINNFTDQDNLRIDIKVPVAEDTDILKARGLAIEAMSTVPAVIQDPAPEVKVTELSDGGPILVLWPRIKIKPYDPENPRQMEDDYYEVFFGVREAVYNAFLENNIGGPSNVVDVNMRKSE